MLKIIIALEVILGIYLVFRTIKIRGTQSLWNVLKFLAFPISMFALGLAICWDNNITPFIAVCVVPISVHYSATLVESKMK